MAEEQSKAQAGAKALSEPVRVGGSAAEATLSGGELAWRPTGGGGGGGEAGRLELESEVLGVRVDGRALRVATFARGDDAAAAAARPATCGGGERRREREREREVVVEMESEEAAAAWGDAMRDRLASLRPKRLFIIVNPYGGKRGGRKIFQTEVLPLIEAAGILYTMQTKHRLHAQEIAHSLDLRKYDGIVCVSGDGVLVEVVNGLLQREDWNTAIKIPLGIIPAHKRPLDVTSVVQGKTRFFSVLMLTWLVADIDIESEKYRWMGSARLDFYSLLRVVSLRRYNGRVLFVPAPGYEGLGDLVEQISSCKSNGASTGVQEDRSNDFNDETCAYAGPSIDETDHEWRSLDGPFVSVWVSGVPFASENVMTAPEAKFGDGYLDVAIIKDCPRSALAGLMFQMKDGSYVKSPYVEYFKVKALRIEPGMRVGSTTKGGIIDSDGEVIARGDGSHTGDEIEHLMAYGPPIQLTVDQGLATIFSPR
uniref:Sphingosine kinase n=1 Tax=Oryza sativa subsp. japonica TaxID=39947 RepID=Q8H350_ORYSJ|nr:putative sphingosine kinase [Oryza sativa Japonica Group]BAD30563.1 putative sphingosine kinase [Oryza sativa Japonica Group]